MEELLWLYAQDYDAHYPVVCFDERPCFLIGDVLTPVPMESGQVKREHYMYTKHGSCCLLAAIEPLTAKRVFRVQARRTKKEYAYFLRDLAQEYPQARKIRLVQDNLNTHTLGALYDFFPAAEAFALAQRFEFYFTPKGASWLNMIEIEFSTVSRLCLNRRIPCMTEMAREVEAFRACREKENVKINWQFSIQTARTKLARHYNKVNPQNQDG